MRAIVNHRHCCWCCYSCIMYFYIQLFLYTIVIYSAWKRQHSISFIYRYYHLSIPDPNPSTLTVLNSNFLQLGRRSGGRPQRTVYPQLSTVKHTALAGIEPTTFRLLVQRATSCATQTIKIRYRHRPYCCVTFGEPRELRADSTHITAGEEWDRSIHVTATKNIDLRGHRVRIRRCFQFGVL